MLLPLDSCSVASGKIVGVLSKFSSGQAHNLKFTATVCSAQQKSKELSHQGDSDFLNTDFLQVRLEALKENKQIRFKAAEYMTIYYSLFSI